MRGKLPETILPYKQDPQFIDYSLTLFIQLLVQEAVFVLVVFLQQNTGGGKGCQPRLKAAAAAARHNACSVVPAGPRGDICPSAFEFAAAKHIDAWVFRIG